MLVRDAHPHLASALGIGCALLLGAAAAQAQSTPRPEDVQAAGRAFQEAQSAQLRGDHAQAAELYDLAHRSAPSAAAMRSAIRMHQAAGHAARAANLASDALRLYASDAATVALANEALTALRPTLGQLTVTCLPACTLAIDGRALATGSAERSELFVDVGTHLVQGSWETQVVEQRLEVSLGVPATLELTQPALPVVAMQEPEPEPTPEPMPVAPPAVDESSSGLSPAFFLTAAALTVVSTGFAIGLGVDMYSAQRTYIEVPTEAGWRDGVGREMRTNALIGTSIGLAAVSLGLAFLTDWDGDASSTRAAHHGPRFAGSVSHEGAYGSLTLSF